jgi:hypothetical protein
LPEDVKAFLSLALERFKQSAEAEAEIRKDALDDYKFSIGEQWPDNIKTERSRDGKPCLTINRIKQFIHQVTNEQRQQRPSIQVNPVGDGADIDTAEIEQGIIRHIEVNSDAEVAYDIAFDHTVRIGFGWFRVLTDYISEENDDQEILIRPIRNPFTVYDDPAAIMPDRSDARYRFVVEDIPDDTYKEKYKDSTLASDLGMQSTGDAPAIWVPESGIRTAEYWYLDETMKVMLRLEDGSLKEESEVAEIQRKSKRRREMTKRKVKCAKINAVEILEKYTWEGKWIPVVPVLGTDLEIDGKRHLSGLVRDAKDAQRAFNYWTTAATEAIALAPKAPWLIEEGQIEGHETEWSTSNVRNTAVLVYKGHSVNGTPAPPPQRIVAEPPIQAMVLMVAQADNNLKSTTGINAATLGEPESERSGKAVLLRQKQSDIATLNFTDNLARSIRHTGRILIDLIPHIYDAPRVQRIIKPDQTVDTVGIYNSQHTDTQKLAKIPEMADMLAAKKIYDIGVGNYDISVSVGPSYQSKRQEAAATMLELFKSNPSIVPVAGDILVRNMDFPGSQEVAGRLKKMLPPQLQDDDDGTDPEVKVQQLQGQLQQMSQQHELLTGEVNKLTQMIETKQVEARNKYDIEQTKASYQLDIERLKIEGQVAIAEINTKAQESQARLKLESDMFSKLHVSSHERAMQADQQGHEANQASQQQGVDLAKQGMQQDHEQNMASQQQGVDMTMAEQQQANQAGQ